jgi:AAA+ ATPase superfamily predicted ATPase
MMVGRTEEITIMKQLLTSKEAELLAIVGRRRVGKTFLIREVYKENIVFEFVGIQNGSRKEQLNNFLFELKNTFGKENIPALVDNWLEAFQVLITSLSNILPKKNK